MAFITYRSILISRIISWTDSVKINVGWSV